MASLLLYFMFTTTQNYISQNITSHRLSPRNTGVMPLKIIYKMLYKKSFGFIKNELVKLLSNRQTNLHIAYTSQTELFV